VKLNLGCGKTKLEGYVNIDVDSVIEPDLVLDFVRQPLPYETGSVDEVVMFHTIEHIQKFNHPLILREIHRVLRVGGSLYLSYPWFERCFENWKNNKLGFRDFWHATMFGRQLHPADFHFCAMDPTELEIVLRDVGFNQVKSIPEPEEDFNAITVGVKIATITYRDLLAEEFETTTIHKVPTFE